MYIMFFSNTTLLHHPAEGSDINLSSNTEPSLKKRKHDDDDYMKNEEKSKLRARAQKRGNEKMESEKASAVTAE